MNKVLKLYSRRSYGHIRYYPICELAHLVRSVYLLGRKSAAVGFPEKAIEIFRREGYDVQISKEESTQYE